MLPGIFRASAFLDRLGVDHVVVSAYPVTTEAYWNKVVAKRIHGYIDSLRYSDRQIPRKYARTLRISGYAYEGFLIPILLVFGNKPVKDVMLRLGLNSENRTWKILSRFLEHGHLFLTKYAEDGLSTPGVVRERMSKAFFYPRWNTICFPCLDNDLNISRVPDRRLVEHEVEHALHYAENRFEDVSDIEDSNDYDNYGASYYLSHEEVRARTHELVSAIQDLLDKQRAEYEDNKELLLSPKTALPVRGMARRAKRLQEQWFGKLFGQEGYVGFQTQILQHTYHQGPVIIFSHTPNMSVFIEHLLDALREPASNRTRIQEQAIRYVIPRLQDLYSDLKKQYSRVFPKPIINHMPSQFR